METEMGIILEFRLPAEPASREAGGETRNLGHVIIFPGVRIERQASESAPDGPGTPQRKRAQRARKKHRR